MKGAVTRVIGLLYFLVGSISYAGDAPTQSAKKTNIAPVIEYQKGDVLAIGQAVYNVYVECKTPEELTQYTKKFGVRPGQTVIINKNDAEYLSEKIRHPLKRYAGGGSANTAAGVAALGGGAAFIGAVARDRAGYNFDEDMHNIGVETRNVVIKNAHEDTGIVFSFITSDGERTMLHYPGVSNYLRDKDINWDLIKHYRVVFLEGYLWADKSNNSQLVHKAFDIARAAGTTTAFGLGSAELANKYRSDFSVLLSKVDILFATELELIEMMQAPNLETAVEQVRNQVKIAVITRGADGALVATPDAQFTIPAVPVAKVIDTTGAGDMFAAGFLYGYTHNLSLVESAKLGSLLAGRIIQQIGSKPEQRMPELLKELKKLMK